MEKNEIIYKTKPKIFNIYIVVISFSIGGYFIYTSALWLGTLIMFCVFILPPILDIIRNYFANAIVISEKRICLLRKNFNGKTIFESIDYSDVKSIRYNRGGFKHESAIYLETKNKSSIKVLIPTTSFKFGKVLKFLNDRGIRIELVHSDDELRRFLDGKITEFPMQNEPSLD